jgi:hypothetical protein
MGKQKIDGRVFLSEIKKIPGAVNSMNPMVFGYRQALIGALSVALTGCAAQDLAKFNQNLTEFNASIGAGSNGAPIGSAVGLAKPTTSVQSRSMKRLVPSDKATATAMESAMPLVNKVVGIHSCVNNSEGLRMLNFHGVPGRDFRNNNVGGVAYSPMEWMKYHDKSQCLAVRVLDQWAMPALNALTYRVVYFAEDSGETIQFQFQMGRQNDGVWLLSGIGGI